MKTFIKKPSMQKARKFSLAVLAIAAVACSPTKTASPPSGLYQVLTAQGDGGGNIRFYEIVSETKEMAMLRNDEHLKGKVSAADLNTANFVILNMGEQPTGGYGIGVEKVEELPDKIVVTVKETKPDPGSMVTQAITYPYAVVRVNSKKPLEIK
jgi:hypothetical protein